MHRKVRAARVLVFGVQGGGPHDLAVEPAFELPRRPPSERVHPTLLRFLLSQLNQQQRLRVRPLNEGEYGAIDDRPWIGLVAVDRPGQASQS